MEGINVELKSVDASTELIVREGSALELKAPVKITISGDIRSVSAFIAKRKGDEKAGLQAVNLSRAIVKVDQEKKSITLDVDPEDYYSPVIEGKLTVTSDLSAFGLNTTKRFSREDLVKLLRHNKRFFKDAGQYDELLAALRRVDLKVKIDSTKGSDDRGNKEDVVIQTVENNVPKYFVLTLPVFKGFQTISFRVEILCEVTSGSVYFWLESPELTDVVEQHADTIFKAQLAAAEGFVIIYS